MHACIHIYMTYIYTCMHIHTYTYSHIAYIRTCIHTSHAMYIYTHASIHICMPYIYTCMHSQSHAYTYIYMACIHIYVCHRRSQHDDVVFAQNLESKGCALVAQSNLLVDMHAFIRTCMHAYIYIHAFIHTCIHIHTCMHIYMPYIYIHACMHKCIHTSHTYAHAFVHRMHIHTLSTVP